MANENELIVIFGADGKPLEKTLGELEADLKAFNKQLQEVKDGGAIVDLNKKLADTKSNISAIKSAGLGKELAGIRPGAASASGALLSLNRVVQDAPFGFIAIQNNLTELPAAFASLTASTGSAVGAFKALGGALLGPAGIGFAISAITSLATTAIQKYGSFGNAIAAIVGNLSDSAIAQQAFTKALEEANKEAGGELAKLELLVSAARDQTRGTDERHRAVADLRKEFKPYFSDLTDEAILNGRVTEATLKARDAVVARARSTAASKSLADVETELLNIDVKRADAAEKYVAAQQKLTKETQLQNKFRQDNAKNGFTPLYTGSFLSASTGVTSAVSDLQKLSDAEKGFLKQREFLLTKFQTEDTTIPQITLEKTATGKDPGLSLEQLFFKIRQEEGKQFQKLIDESEKGADDYFKAMGKNLADGERIRKVIQKMNSEMESQRLGITAVVAPERGSFAVDNDPQIVFEDKKAQLLAKFRKANLAAPDVSFLSDVGAQTLLLSQNFDLLIKRSDALGAIAQDVLQPAFTSLFTNLLSGSQSAIQAVTGFFKSLITQILSTIAAAAALAAVFSIFGFTSGGVSGFGGLFKKFIGGGSGGGGGLGGLFGGGGFGYSGLSYGGGIGPDKLVASVSGRDLNFVLQRGQNSDRRLGG